MRLRDSLLFQINPLLLIIGLLAIPQLVNISYFDGLGQDFSGLVLQISEPNQTTYPEFQIIEMQPGEWALVNVSVPETQYTLNILSSGSQPSSNASAPQQELPSWAVVNVSYAQGLLPDFSNLALEISTSQGTYQANFTLLGFRLSQWAQVNVTVPQLPYTLNILSSNSTAPSGNTTNTPYESLPPAQSPENISNQTTSNLTQNLTPPGQNQTLNESQNLTPIEQNQTLNESQNITQPEQNQTSNLTSSGQNNVNVSFFEGLQIDFSNLAVWLYEQNATLPIAFQILQMEPGAWRC